MSVNRCCKYFADNVKYTDGDVNSIIGARPRGSQLEQGIMEITGKLQQRK